MHHKSREDGGIQNQMYRDKLQALQAQLASLHQGTHPDCLEGYQKLEAQHKHRLFVNRVSKQLELERVKQDIETQKKLNAKEFEERRAEIKETMMVELEEKRKQIEHDHQTMDLNGDVSELKPMATRKLRRRPNEPTPLAEKRQRKSPPRISFEVNEEHKQDDIDAIWQCHSKQQSGDPQFPTSSCSSSGSQLAFLHLGSPPRMDVGPGSPPTESGSGSDTVGLSPVRSKLPSGSSVGGHIKLELPESQDTHTIPEFKASVNCDRPSDSSPADDDFGDERYDLADEVSVYSEITTVENGKLIHDQKCYQKGHNIFYENNQIDIGTGVITNITSRDIWIKKLDGTGARVRITVQALQKGKSVLRKL